MDLPRFRSRPCKKLFCLFILLAGMNRLAAADYYVDPAGNDSNAGTSPAAPWQSLGKVNGTVFQPGDNVLFKRGGTWVGTLSPQGSGNSSALTARARSRSSTATAHGLTLKRKMESSPDCYK
jgi:hypothetical protein